MARNKKSPEHTKKHIEQNRKRTLSSQVKDEIRGQPHKNIILQSQKIPIKLPNS